MAFVAVIMGLGPLFYILLGFRMWFRSSEASASLAILSVAVSFQSWGYRRVIKIRAISSDPRVGQSTVWAWKGFSTAGRLVESFG